MYKKLNNKEWEEVINLYYQQTIELSSFAMTLSAQKNTSNKHKAVFEKEYGFFAYINLKIVYK